MTQKQIFEELKRSAPCYDAIEHIPHEPPLPNVYYACETPRDGDGSLDLLIDRFCPATEPDRELIRGMFLTAFWGGAPGSRPAFLITSLFGRGVGKSKLAQMLGYLVGGMIDISAREDIEQIKQRLLTPAAMTTRLVTLDNIKSFRFSSAEIESLITSDRISGKRMYHGEAQRPNHLTWLLTLNAPGLSTDIAQRCIVIELDKPKRSGAWEDETRRFIDDHREGIVGDILAALRRRPEGFAVSTRWATWGANILGRLHGPETLQRLIAERQRGADVEHEEAAIIHEAIVGELFRRRIDPHATKLFIPSTELALWLERALNERITTTTASRRLNQMIEEGTLKNLERNRTNSRGRGFVWCGDDAIDKPCTTLSVPSPQWGAEPDAP